MDLTRPIIYRDFTLNDPNTHLAMTGGGATGTGITGCIIDSIDFSDVDVVQFLEKRSQQDGMDAGPVELGTRRIRLSGTLYALTRAALYDALWDLRAALNPVLAQREEPLDKGYRPFYFTVPTADIDNYPDEVIELQVKAMPRAFQQMVQIDNLGGNDDDPLAITWQATMLCRDPGILSADPVEVDFTATTTHAGTTTGANATDLFTVSQSHGLSAGDRITFLTLTGGSSLNKSTAYYVLSSGLTSTQFKLSLTSGGSTVDLGSDVTAATWVKSSTASGDWVNRGTYLGVFQMLVEVGAGAGSISVTVGDSAFTIAIPVSTVNRTIRVKGDDKILTVQETDDTEETRLSYITFSGDTTWPLIDPGSTPYSVTFHGMGGIVDGSRMWFYEQMA